MAPEGFEPPTPGLKVQCSDQAELRSHKSMNKFRFKRLSLRTIILNNRF